MKKKIMSIGLIGALCITSVAMLAGCGSKQPYDYDLSEYVEVGNYKGLEYDKISVSVSDSEVQDEIDARLEENSTEETVKTGTVEDGDTISISYEGILEGESEPFDGGSAEDQEVTIGVDSFIDGFLEGLIGEDVGSTVELDLTFPDEYSQNADLQGKNVTFTVTINSKTIDVIPKYDLDFVKEHSDYDNLADYEASVKKELLEQKQSDAENEIKQAMWEEIVDSSEAKKYPEEELESTKQSLIDSMKQEAENYGMEWEEYLEAVGYTEEELDEMAAESAEKMVFQDMIIYAIAAAEGLEVTNDEYEDYMANMLSASGFTESTFEDSYGMTIEEYCEQNSLRTSLLMNKVMDKVFEYGVEK